MDATLTAQAEIVLKELMTKAPGECVEPAALCPDSDYFNDYSVQALANKMTSLLSGTGFVANAYVQELYLTYEGDSFSDS